MTSKSLTATSLICTLNPSPTPSSSDLISTQISDELSRHSVATTSFRIADHTIKFGVEKDMGGDDEWPLIRQSILKSNILIIATPIWMGQPSSIAKMVMERLDAELAEETKEGLPTMYGKVAIVGIVGNEDGAHHTSAELFQALSDVGFTIPAGGPAYWVGEAMGSTDYRDLKESPSATVTTIQNAASNAVHLSQLLQNNNYPVPSQ